MSKNELECMWELSIDLPYREKVEELQEIFTNQIEAQVEHNDGKVVYPTFTKYNHYFSDGLYIREMSSVKDSMFFTVIHNVANPLFLMTGKVAFSSEDGVEELVAPTFILTKPGAKRICYWIEDSVLVTVHPNPKGLTDLDEIEKEMFSTTWEEYEKQDESMKQDTWVLLEHDNYFKKLENEENK